MTQITIGTWQHNSVSGPLQAAGLAVGLIDGEQVQIEVRGDDILIRRSNAKAKMQADTLAAVERLIERSKSVSLGDVTLRELIDEGRRG